MYRLKTSCLLFVLSCLTLSPASANEAKVSGDPVTRETYTRAETDRSFFNIASQAGGVNRFFYIRKPTPLDGQTVVRMNRDTHYAAAIVDTSEGATVTVPEMPGGRYFSLLLIDNDHYSPGVIYTSGKHELPRDTKYLAVILRIQLLKPKDPEDVALVNSLQDKFVIEAASADPFPKPKWDPEQLSSLTGTYNAESAKYERYPEGFMGPRGKADETIRHLGTAGAWGLFPNRDAIYLNYNGHLKSDKCYTARYDVPEHNAFWSITLYGEDGYMKSDNAILNGTNVTLNADGSFDAHFGSVELCGNVQNRIDTTDGWNFLMRVYRPGATVLDGTYKLPDVTPVK
jgi:hypothetical protein